MIRICCTLEGFDEDNLFSFSFDTAHELVRYLRKLGKGQLKQVRISRILFIEEGVL